VNQTDHTQSAPTQEDPVQSADLGGVLDQMAAEESLHQNGLTKEY